MSKEYAGMMRTVLNGITVKGSEARELIKIDDWLAQIEEGDLIVVQSNRFKPSEIAPKEAG